MFNPRGKLSLNFCGKGFNPCVSYSALSCDHQSPKSQKTLRGEKIAFKQTQNNNSKKKIEFIFQIKWLKIYQEMQMFGVIFRKKYFPDRFININNKDAIETILLGIYLFRSAVCR